MLIGKSKVLCVGFYILVLHLIACGSGGGGDSPTPTASVPNISVTGTLDFGGVVLNSFSEQTVEVRNTGNANLAIQQITLTGAGFTISNDTCSVQTIAPSSACSLRVRYTPPNVPGSSPSSGTLSIPSNDPDNGTAIVRLSAVGYSLRVWISNVSSTNNCTDFHVDLTVSNPASNIRLDNLLDPNYFGLYLNGIQRAITPPITNQFPTPVSFVLALDWSPSTDPVRTQIQAGAVSFINQMGVQDEAAVLKFSGRGGEQFYPPANALLSGATGKPQLINFINDLAYIQFTGTALYDAVYSSIYRTSTSGMNTRKAVVVLSDGVDEPGAGVGNSTRTLDEVIAYAVSLDIQVFTIFYVGIGQTGNASIMERMARETGGQSFDAQTANFADIFQQISYMLGNTYSINFTSPVPTCSGTITAEVRYQGLIGADSISFP